MDIQQLSYFIEAAQTMSFRKVSKRYFVSQPSISNSIGSLETELGAKLFFRTSHGVSLTAEGRELLPYATQALETMETAKSRIRDVRSSNKGTIRIACVPGASLVLAEYIKAYIDRYPEILVDIKVVDGYGQIAAMDDDLYDFTFGCYQRSPSSRLSEVHMLRPGFLSLVLPRSQYPDPALVSFSELTGVPFVSISPTTGGPHFYEQVMECCKNRGFMPHVVSFYDNAIILLTAVSAGVGISVLPQNTSSCMSKEIVEIPLKGEDSRHDFYVSWKKSSSNNTAKHFLQMLRDMLGLK